MEILEALKNKYGSQQKVASQFGVRKEAVQRWYANNAIPPRRALKASQLTGIPIARIMEQLER